MHVEDFGQRETQLHIGLLNLMLPYSFQRLVFWHKYYNQWQRSGELIMGEADHPFAK